MFRIICSAILVTSSKAGKGFPGERAGFDVGDKVEYCPDKDYVIETTEGKITYGHQDVDDACLKRVSKDLPYKLTLERIRSDLKLSAARGQKFWDSYGRVQTQYSFLKYHPDNRDIKYASERNHEFFISASTWTEYQGEDQTNLRQRLTQKRKQMKQSHHYCSYPTTHYVCDQDNFLRLFRLTVRDDKWRKATVISKLPQNQYTIRFDDSGCTQTVSAGDYLIERNHTNLRLEDRVVDAYNRLAAFYACRQPRSGYYYRCYGVGIRRGMVLELRNRTTYAFVAKILGRDRTSIEAKISEGKLPNHVIDLLADLEQAIGDEFSKENNKEKKEGKYRAKRRNPVLAHMEQKMDNRVLTLTCSEKCWEEAKKDPIRMNKIRKEERLKKEKAAESEIKARTKARLEKEEAERKEREAAEEEVRRAEEQLNAQDGVSGQLLRYVSDNDAVSFCARVDRMFAVLQNSGLSFKKGPLNRMMKATTIKRKIVSALRLVHDNSPSRPEAANAWQTGQLNFMSKTLTKVKDANNKK